MELPTPEISLENPSLLVLNDDCLRDIFKCLELKDCVNLSETCSRLLCLAQEFLRKCKSIVVGSTFGSPIRAYDFVRKCKNIVVGSTVGSAHTVQEFSDILSVVGEYIESVDVCYSRCDFDILNTIAINCSNLRSVEFDYPRTKVQKNPLPFRNLKELKVATRASMQLAKWDNWENCFANNPGIEHFEYDSREEIDLDLLLMLPELKSLAIHNMNKFMIGIDVDDLACLPNLTKFAFSYNRYEYLEFLNELAEKLRLVELKFWDGLPGLGFPILKCFRHLERLTIIAGGEFYCISEVPENTIFPTSLKQITFVDFEMSCSSFLSMVKQLKLLEEFDGRIFWDTERYKPNDECDSENDCSHSHICLFDCTNSSKIIARIAKEMRSEERKLTLIACDCFKDNQICKYSVNLEIIRRRKTLFDHSFNVE